MGKKQYHQPSLFETPEIKRKESKKPKVSREEVQNFIDRAERIIIFEDLSEINDLIEERLKEEKRNPLIILNKKGECIALVVFPGEISFAVIVRRNGLLKFSQIQLYGDRRTPEQQELEEKIKREYFPLAGVLIGKKFSLPSSQLKGQPKLDF